MGFLEDKAGLDGKVAVVTGGAGGLGWPIARDLARAGAHVAICDRDQAALDTIAAEMASFPSTFAATGRRLAGRTVRWRA